MCFFICFFMWWRCIFFILHSLLMRPLLQSDCFVPIFSLDIDWSEVTVGRVTVAAEVTVDNVALAKAIPATVIRALIEQFIIFPFICFDLVKTKRTDALLVPKQTLFRTILVSLTPRASHGFPVCRCLLPQVNDQRRFAMRGNCCFQIQIFKTLTYLTN